MSKKIGFFLTQSLSDWKSLAKNITSKKHCVIKTVILPSGIELNDPRLLQGKVIEEREIETTVDEIWGDQDGPFEVDIDQSVLPREFKGKGTAHIGVFGDTIFENKNACPRCEAA